MAHSGEIKELDSAGLRNFGLTMAAVVVCLFGLFFPWVFDAQFPVWPWIIAAAMTTWSLVAPATLRLVYKGWMKLGILISKVTTPLVLGIVFFLVVTPFGLVRRVFTRDALSLNIDEDANTYRQKSVKRPKEGLERPY